MTTQIHTYANTAREYERLFEARKENPAYQTYKKAAAALNQLWLHSDPERLGMGQAREGVPKRKTVRLFEKFCYENNIPLHIYSPDYVELECLVSDNSETCEALNVVQKAHQMMVQDEECQEYHAAKNAWQNLCNEAFENDLNISCNSTPMANRKAEKWTSSWTTHTTN